MNKKNELLYTNAKGEQQLQLVPDFATVTLKIQNGTVVDCDVHEKKKMQPVMREKAYEKRG